jgi:two-component system response regulator protein BraR/BceR
MELPVALVIDLDESFERMVPALQDAGFQVVHVPESTQESTQEVARALARSPVVIIVGEGMVSIDGVDLLPLLRSLTDCPIVAIGIEEEVALVKAMLEGADVCLPRPLNVPILMAHIRALLRRYEAD